MRIEEGDKVVIKAEYDEGKCAQDYRFSFSEEMLEEWGGQTLTVEDCYDGSIYLKEARGFTWSPEMFARVIKPTRFTKKRGDIYA